MVNRAEGTLTQDGVALVEDNPFDAHVDEGFGLLLEGLARSEETQVLQHFEATDQGRI